MAASPFWWFEIFSLRLFYKKGRKKAGKESRIMLC